MRWFLRFECFAVLSLVGLASLSAAADHKGLEEALKAKYELTSTGIDHVRITKPGTLLILQQDGILGNPSSDFGSLTTKVIDGKVVQPKGFGAAFFAKKTDRPLKSGEGAYITRIGVRDKEVRLDIITSDTAEVSVSGNSQQIRYAATVAFQCPEGFLETADANSVKKIIDGVLLPKDEVQAANTKTVEIGQTPDQVQAILGAPDKIVNLGPKKIYVYKDMKIVFVEDKVSDVQ